MIKRSSKRYYEFEGKRMTVKQIFDAYKKRRGRSRYLLYSLVNISAKDAEGNEKQLRRELSACVIVRIRRIGLPSSVRI